MPTRPARDDTSRLPLCLLVVLVLPFTLSAAPDP
jgi:hypothetical protein